MKAILLVDDNADFREILKDFLKKHDKKNYKFIEASNPIEALDSYYQYLGGIDIVICDFFMPIQNGNDFLEIIKQNRPTTKCFLVSGDQLIKDRKYKYVDQTFSKLDLNELLDYL